MSDVIGQCSSCRGDVTRNQRADYLGDHIRHGNRSDCICPLQAEIERLREALRYYTDAGCYDCSICGEGAFEDDGHVARAALSGSGHG